MHTGRNSSSNLALSTQSCPLKLGKNFSAAHKFPNFVSGHTGSFGCTTSRKADNPKCVTLTSIHFAPCQVRFNINQSQYIIKAKLKVSSKFGKKQICMKLKATPIHLRTGVVTTVRFLNTASALNQSPGLQALLFHPLPHPAPLLSFRSDSSFFSVQMLLTHPQILHLFMAGRFWWRWNCTFPEWGLLHWDFPHCCASTCCSLSVWTFIPSPKPNKDTQSTKCHPRFSQSVKMVSSGQLLTLQENQTQNSGCFINTGGRTAQTHPKGFLFLF